MVIGHVPGMRASAAMIPIASDQHAACGTEVDSTDDWR
jgi:hypothetical protein